MTEISVNAAAAPVAYREFSGQEKSAWAKQQAADNAAKLTQTLGFEVNPRLPFVLLDAANQVCESLTDRTKFVTRLCRRGDHFENSIKVLATAILHYDLAANLVGTRRAGQLHRSENTLFSDLLKMAPRTVDNAIYTLKRAGLYLSFEQREATEDGYRGRASIKRLNMALFNLLGLGKFASIQRNLAKQRAEVKKITQTPAEKALGDYRKTDDAVREKRDTARAEAARQRAEALRQQQAGNRTQAILAALDAGEDLDTVKAQFSAPVDDIPY